MLFPWTVSDYPLVDAIEAGLTKIPRVPIRDESGAEEPMFRSLHTAVRKTHNDARLPPKGQPLPQPLDDALRRMVEDWERTCAHYEQFDIDPILLIVADTISNAERLLAEIGGYRNTDGTWTPGRFPNLSNVDARGHVRNAAPTLLVHSRLDEEKDTTLAGKVSQSDNAAVHAADEALSAAGRMSKIRELFNTAGRRDGAGAHIRCIISVSMLTEGWDAKPVTHIVGYRAFGSELLCEQVAGRALRRSTTPEPGAAIKPEYANIVGIPFRYMQAKEQGDPGVPKRRWPVRALPGREHLRIDLPKVLRWHQDRPGARAELAETLGPAPSLSNGGGPGAVDLEGSTGETLALAEGTAREQTALWRLAGRVHRRCQAGGGDAAHTRLTSFASIVRASKRYLAHHGIDAAALTTDARAERVAADIERHLRWGGAEERAVAVPDEPPHADTAETSFTTTLLRYPYEEDAVLERSELNAAACHSKFEQHVAHLLERLPGVDAWVRNFRLGWTIPWYDPQHARWHSYEPDFVARVPDIDGNGTCGYLVVEVKGVRDLPADEKMRTADLWCERVSDGATGHDEGRWRYIMIEDYDTAGDDLAAAVHALRAH